MKKAAATTVEQKQTIMKRPAAADYEALGPESVDELVPTNEEEEVTDLSSVADPEKMPEDEKEEEEEEREKVHDSEVEARSTCALDILHLARP